MKVRVLPTPVKTVVVVVKWRVSSTVFVPDLFSREKLVLRVRIYFVSTQTEIKSQTHILFSVTLSLYFDSSFSCLIKH